jgi:fructose-specific PTS system IIC-like component
MTELGTIFKGTRRHLMSGVSYMIPFVVAGGILLSIPVAFSTGSGGTPAKGSFLFALFTLGKLGLGYMVPIFSGYVAFSIADRVGIAPGVIGGAVAASIGAGFLGGIISGMLAGIICYYLKKVPVPKSVRSVMPILVIPLVGTFAVWLVMTYLVGRPIADAMGGLNTFLAGMTHSNPILLGLIVGAMIGFDLGGPVNKVAYTFGATIAMASVSTWGGGYIAAMDVAICVPPLAMAAATFINGKRFTLEEREAGKPALLMGLVGITEGAIPFAAGDPLRVIAATVTGSAVGAATALGLTATKSSVAWGGLVGLAGSPGVASVLAYVIAVLAGVAVTTVMVLALKRKTVEQEPAEDDLVGLSDNADSEFTLTIA